MNSSLWKYDLSGLPDVVSSKLSCARFQVVGSEDFEQRLHGFGEVIILRDNEVETFFDERKEKDFLLTLASLHGSHLRT